MNSLNNWCLSGYGYNNSFAAYNIHATLGQETEGGVTVYPFFLHLVPNLYGIDCIFWISLTTNCVLNKGLILFQKDINEKLIIMN